jgi:hypothetical protein
MHLECLDNLKLEELAVSVDMFNFSSRGPYCFLCDTIILGC